MGGMMSKKTKKRRGGFRYGKNVVKKRKRTLRSKVRASKSRSRRGNKTIKKRRKKRKKRRR